MTHDLKFGIRINLGQFLSQLWQVLLVGLTLGMMRTVIPALSESEFDVPANSFMLLVTFVVAFGFIKGCLNFVAGHLSERIGRKHVLMLGWLVALPIPPMILYAQSWNWIVLATILLGINQGLAWSMTQTSKLDLTNPEQRGLTIGLNEFSGYFGVAMAGIITGYLSDWIGAREGLMWFGMTIIILAIISTQLWIKDTLAWAKAEANSHRQGKHAGPVARYPKDFPQQPSTLEVFTLLSWRDKRMFAFCQAGLIEKFVDSIIWVFYPVYLYQQGLSLANIGWVVGIYGFVWGGSQFITGKLSDHIGRLWPITIGMWLCGGGVMLTLLGNSLWWWSTTAAMTGFGMALLYPNLSAAVSDISHPAWRGTAIGVYRFWRDLGYGIGALLLGISASMTGQLSSGFWLVAIAMLLSGLVVWIYAEETHPRLNPATSN